MYRAFYALPPLTNSKGQHTNAVYGFTTMLMKIIREHQPTYLGVVFDEKGPTIRHEEFTEYKAHRPEMPGDMQSQIPFIHQVVEAFGLPVIRMAGLEADDLIGTLAKQAAGPDLNVVIVTGDKDMFQLLTPAVCIFDPVKGKWIGEAECHERFGVEPARVVDIMGLMGDSADNIPGVKGIGEKTAKKLITEFGTIEELLSRIEEVKAPKTRSLLQEQADQARLSKKLATILVDCPITFDPGSFQLNPPQEEPLKDLFRELEFTTLLKTFQSADTAEERWGVDVETLENKVAVAKWLKGIGNRTALGLHILGSHDAKDRGTINLLGIAGAAEGHSAIFLTGDIQSSLKEWQVLLQDPNKEKAIHDVKPVIQGCRQQGFEVQGPLFDTMIADYLLNPNRRGHTLETLALEVLGYQFEATDKKANKPPSNLFEEPQPLDPRPIAEAAVVVSKLVPIQKIRLKEQGSLSLFEQVEMPLVSVLAEIESNGFLLDETLLNSLNKEMEHDLTLMMDEITNLAGEEFNVNSPKQLAVVLFDKLGLTPLRKTKTGYSTDEDTLTQLATEHDLPGKILQYRSVNKLKSTYVDALPSLVNPTSKRLHTSLNQTVAATGRLSSTDPNLQNIPIKGEYGLRIREAFIAPPGHTLVCGDYSQIEPRLLAHFSQDARMVQVFEREEDMHTATAVDIFNLAEEHITRDMRRIAKTVVFGILYGISPYGLSQTLNITQGEAKEYIDAYFKRYIGVRAFMDRTIQEAKQTGYTTTILGRRRPIPELHSANQTQRSFGERMAVNSPIQGSAADVIKLAMIKVSERLPQELPGTKMILQVHDELIFEVPDCDVDKAKEFVQENMEAIGAEMALSVPLKVEVGVGPNWRLAHP